MHELKVLIVIASRLVQVGCNQSAGSTGQISALSVFLLCMGSLGLTYTSIQDSGHSLHSQACVLSSCCSALLLLQWRSDLLGQLCCWGGCFGVKVRPPVQICIFWQSPEGLWVGSSAYLPLYAAEVPQVTEAVHTHTVQQGAVCRSHRISSSGQYSPAHPADG
ncbi:hypothetical protein MHYP_G00284930 [Metynnis hypsauchen]